MRFKTLSGSHYEIQDDRIRRVNENYEKRADGRWLRLLDEPLIDVGWPVVLKLEPLSEIGPDDFGDEAEASPHTIRITSAVTEVTG